MGKSESGPDMQDCSTYLREVEKAHKSRITIMLESDGSEGGYGWSMHALMLPAKVSDPWETPGCGAGGAWPHRDHKTFEGALFALVARLDALAARQDFWRIVKPE